MSDYDEALSQIAEIRSQIAASTSFRGFAPAQFAASALVCAVIALAQSFWPPLQPRSGAEFVAVWGIVLAGISLIAAVESHGRAIRAHGVLADMLLGATVRRLAPYALSMAAIGFVVGLRAPDAAWLVPGLWLILMGLAGFATASSLPRMIGPVAMWFLGSGVFVLIVAAGARQAEPWMLGVPLAVGHGVVALVFRAARQEAGQ